MYGTQGVVFCMQCVVFNACIGQAIDVRYLIWSCNPLKMVTYLSKPGVLEFLTIFLKPHSPVSTIAKKKNERLELFANFRRVVFTESISIITM